MHTPQGIVIFGANGSGKTTLGRELARLLGIRHMDIEDYCFEESDIPYSKTRTHEAWTARMLADIERHRTFVVSGTTGDFGDIIPMYYKLAVHLSAPHELRLERVKQRAFDQYGSRVLEGGDMYEQEQRFFDFVAARPLSRIDEWARTLTCPVMHLDGRRDWRDNAAAVAHRFNATTL